VVSRKKININLLPALHPLHPEPALGTAMTSRSCCRPQRTMPCTNPVRCRADGSRNPSCGLSCQCARQAHASVGSCAASLNAHGSRTHGSRNLVSRS